MKIQMTEDSRKIITLADMPAVRRLIREMKEDNYIKEYGGMAARVASGEYDTFEILKAEAEVAKNNRVFNAFFDGSENLDIWCRFYAYNSYYGFYEIGAYITDIWNITGDNSDEIRQQMYINAFRRER